MYTYTYMHFYLLFITSDNEFIIASLCCLVNPSFSNFSTNELVSKYSTLLEFVLPKRL